MKGGGRYGEQCLHAMRTTGGKVVLLIVIEGDAGTGFSLVSAVGPEPATAMLPAVLRDVANSLERDGHEPGI